MSSRNGIPKKIPKRPLLNKKSAPGNQGLQTDGVIPLSITGATLIPTGIMTTNIEARKCYLKNGYPEPPCPQFVVDGYYGLEAWGSEYDLRTPILLNQTGTILLRAPCMGESPSPMNLQIHRYGYEMVNGVPYGVVITRAGKKYAAPAMLYDVPIHGIGWQYAK